ncbi:GGDEF domain-containing protein [Phycisphaeraceae bacterium D3-23]
MAIHEELLERVLRSPRLPSIPAVALKIIDLVQQDEVDMDEIAETIKHDPALSTKILKTVNSSFYGQPKTISSINQALIVLGLNSVKTLALGFSLVGNLTEAGGEGFDHVAFWKRSLYSATASKEICDIAGIVQAEEVFMSSLLQDVGMLALGQVLGSEYAHLLKQAGEDHRKLVGLEQEALSGDHAEVGGALAERWGLPPVLSEPIRFHESPEDAEEIVTPLVRAVVAGGYIADLLLAPDDAETVGACGELLESWYGLDPEKAKPLLAQIQSHAAEIQRLFDLPTGELGSAEEILLRANEALERIGLNAAKTAHELARDNKQLRQEANTDCLTGIGNRRSFDRCVAEAFIHATAQAPMSVLFLDIDHFKRFNDAHGHTVGDEVLRLYAKVLTQTLGEEGECFRYGGEEFAIVAPRMDRKLAAELAERVREAIDQQVRVVVEDGVARNVTTSVGVASYEGVFFKRADQVVKAADRGVYAAKQAGRNCVRVFVPKVVPKSDAA